MGSKKEVVAYVHMFKKEIQVDSHKWLELNASNIDIECIWLELIFKHQRNIIVANLYHPPQGNIQIFITYLDDDALCNIDLTNTDIFPLGDFNIDFLEKNEYSKLL